VIYHTPHALYLAGPAEMGLNKNVAKSSHSKWRGNYFCTKASGPRECGGPEDWSTSAALNRSFTYLVQLSKSTSLSPSP